MIIYNVTINIDESVHDNWLDWMQETHIPEVMATGKFINARMTKVLVEEEMGGITYSIQYTAENKEILDKYYAEDAERMRQEVSKHFGNKFVAFRTELAVVKEFNENRLNATEYLFTYGTLQQENIQLTVFSRTLSGFNDVLSGYRLSDEKVVGVYPVMHPSENPADFVHGRVYMCSNKEILEADKYEGPAYKRIKVVLNSGISAWAYISSTRQPN
ncbi:DUF4286 family protein [Eudoraea adriatica]|uniref:DUF4286 family protein n=1 Tax=Eudoraea adriatica TaxID=446681 RepID=UPI00037CC241|nr:DUF4286 family protein [Eudoraea adriatica]